MSTVVLKPQAKQLFEVQPQQSHPRLSLRRVLWVRFLRWIDTTSLTQILKTLFRIGCVIAIALGVFARQFAIDVTLSIIRWNSYKIPIFLALLVTMLNAKRAFNFMRRAIVRTRAGNQNTYRGLPVGELASFLMKHGSFKREEAIKAFALSQGHYQKIAEELEQQGVLKRGENNARVLRDITMENLVVQLRDNFPLIWDEVHQDWTEKVDAYGRYLREQSFKSRKLEETEEKKERKIERLDRKIHDRLSSIQQIQALSA